jgi:hypothetical protein
MAVFRLSRSRRRPGTARRPDRFRRMLSNRALWPGMIGIALAVGIGVQMGESVIGAINPIHFQGAAPPVQAVDPNAPAPAQSGFARDYGWAEGDAARQADSQAGAAAVQDFDYVPQASLQRAAAPAWQADTAPVNLTPWPPGRVSAHPEIERYTDYPIEEKPAARPAPTPAPASQAAPDLAAPDGKAPPAQ